MGADGCGTQSPPATRRRLPFAAASDRPTLATYLSSSLLCSPIFNGELSPFCSGRGGITDPCYGTSSRHAGSPLRDVYDFVERMCQTTYLIHKQSSLVIPNSRPFYEYLEERYNKGQIVDFEAFLFHEHYMWNSSRIRATYGTIEIRPACQQPWRDHMVVMALNVGLIEAATEIQHYIDSTLGPDAWQIMRTYQQQAIRHGLRAPQPANGFLERILHLACAGLQSRKANEAPLLEPLFERLYRNETRLSGRRSSAVMAWRVCCAM